jgi:dolichyl-phosphate-mannose-protein mannosyltransferase
VSVERSSDLRPDSSGPPSRGGAARRGSSFRALADRLVANLRDPATVLPLLLIVALGLRAVWINLPKGSLIFDEAYYVNAARILLGWTVAPGANYAGSPVGLDPNTEHPPLGKLLIAASMLVFGDNGVGWRLPSLIAGMTALGALYLIVRAAGESAWLAILAVGFLAFDNLTLVHGRIGTLDMMVLAPMLLASWLALRDRWALAGVLLGVAALIKVTALYGLLALLILAGLRLLDEVRRDRRLRLSSLRPSMAMTLTFVAVALVGLWLLDARFTTFASPIDHIRRIFDYGANLKAPVDQAGICPGADSGPWQWLFNQCQITYLRVDVTVRSGEKVLSTLPSIDFRGALNPVLAGAIPLATLFLGWFAWRTKSVLARWSLVWAAANYLPFVALAVISQRVMYIYYMLPVVPAIAVALAVLLLRSRLPRFVLWGFVAVYVAGFVAYFPFRHIP